MSLFDCEQIHRNKQRDNILHLITNLDLNARSNEIPEENKSKRRKKFQSSQSHFNKYNAHGSYCPTVHVGTNTKKENVYLEKKENVRHLMVCAVSCLGGSSMGRIPTKRKGSSLNLTATPSVLYPA